VQLARRDANAGKSPGALSLNDVLPLTISVTNTGNSGNVLDAAEVNKNLVFDYREKFPMKRALLVRAKPHITR
jgi:hypothetical protein